MLFQPPRYPQRPVQAMDAPRDDGPRDPLLLERELLHLYRRHAEYVHIIRTMPKR